MSNPYTHEQTQEEIQKIGQILERDLLKKLRTVPAEFLQYKDYSTLQKMEEQLIHSSIPIIVEHFGLLIKIVNYQREQTKVEIAEMNILEEARIESLQSSRLALIESEKEKRDRLQILYGRRKELLSEGIGKGDPVYEEISEEIGQMEETIIVKDPGKVHPRLPEGRPKEFSFDMFGGNPSKQIEGKKEENPPENQEDQPREEKEEPKTEVDIEL